MSIDESTTLSPGKVELHPGKARWCRASGLDASCCQARRVSALQHQSILVSVCKLLSLVRGFIPA